MSACESSATLGLLLASEAWTTITQTVLRVWIFLFLSTLGWLSPFDGPNHQISEWYCLVLFPFLLRTGLFLLLVLGFLSANKLSLLLFSVFAVSGYSGLYSYAAFGGLLTFYESSLLPEFIQLLALGHQHSVILFSGELFQLNLSSKSAMTSTGFLLLGRFDLFDRCNLHTWCWCFLVNILGEKATTVWRNLSRCALTAATAVDNLSHLMPCYRYLTFDPGSRHWYPYSRRFPRKIWYSTWWATYSSQFHSFFSPSYVAVYKEISASEAVMFTWYGLASFSSSAVWGNDCLFCVSSS